MSNGYDQHEQKRLADIESRHRNRILDEMVEEAESYDDVGFGPEDPNATMGDLPRVLGTFIATPLAVIGGSLQALSQAGGGFNEGDDIDLTEVMEYHEERSEMMKSGMSRDQADEVLSQKGYEYVPDNRTLNQRLEDGNRAFESVAGIPAEYLIKTKTQQQALERIGKPFEYIFTKPLNWIQEQLTDLTGNPEASQFMRNQFEGLGLLALPKIGGNIRGKIRARKFMKNVREAKVEAAKSRIRANIELQRAMPEGMDILFHREKAIKNNNVVNKLERGFIDQEGNWFTRKQAADHINMKGANIAAEDLKYLKGGKEFTAAVRDPGSGKTWGGLHHGDAVNSALSEINGVSFLQEKVNPSLMKETAYRKTLNTIPELVTREEAVRFGGTFADDMQIGALRRRSMELQRSIDKVEATIRNNPRATKVLEPQLRELNRTKGFTDDAIAAADGQLNLWEVKADVIDNNGRPFNTPEVADAIRYRDGNQAFHYVDWADDRKGFVLRKRPQDKIHVDRLSQEAFTDPFYNKMYQDIVGDLHNPNHPLQWLFEHNRRKGTNVIVDTTDGIRKNVNPNFPDAYGSYNPELNTIFIDMKQLAQHPVKAIDFYETVYHENLHAFIKHTIGQHGSVRHDRLVQDLEKLWDSIGENMKPDYNPFLKNISDRDLSWHVRNMDEIRYGSQAFGTMEELVTYSMLNERFAGWMHTVPTQLTYKGKKGTPWTILKERILSNLEEAGLKDKNKLAQLNYMLDRHMNKGIHELYAAGYPIDEGTYKKTVIEDLEEVITLSKLDKLQQKYPGSKIGLELVPEEFRNMPEVKRLLKPGQKSDVGGRKSNFANIEPLMVNRLGRRLYREAAEKLSVELGKSLEPYRERFVSAPLTMRGKDKGVRRTPEQLAEISRRHAEETARRYEGLAREHGVPVETVRQVIDTMSESWLKDAGDSGVLQQLYDLSPEKIDLFYRMRDKWLNAEKMHGSTSGTLSSLYKTRQKGEYSRKAYFESDIDAPVKKHDVFTESVDPVADYAQVADLTLIDTLKKVDLDKHSPEQIAGFIEKHVRGALKDHRRKSRGQATIPERIQNQAAKSFKELNEAQQNYSRAMKVAETPDQQMAAEAYLERAQKKHDRTMKKLYKKETSLDEIYAKAENADSLDDAIARYGDSELSRGLSVAPDVEGAVIKGQKERTIANALKGLKTTLKPIEQLVLEKVLYSDEPIKAAHLAQMTGRTRGNISKVITRVQDKARKAIIAASQKDPALLKELRDRAFNK